MTLWVYEDLETPNSLFKHGFHIDLNIQDELAIINGYEFKLADVLARSDYYPMSRFVFPFYKVKNYIVNDQSVEYHSFSSMPYNLFGLTKTTSLRALELANLLHQNWPVQVIFYPHSTNFSDALWLVTVDAAVGITSNIEADQVFLPSYIPTQGASQSISSPKCVTTGPSTIAANDTVEIEFEYRDKDHNFVSCNFESYIKVNAGYLPKNIINVVDGKCTAKISALGLDAGDVIKVKFGLGKMYSNAVEHTLTVI
jgi:hypothetical protein